MSEIFKLNNLYEELGRLLMSRNIMAYLALAILYSYSTDNNLDSSSEILRLNQEARQMLFSYLVANQVSFTNEFTGQDGSSGTYYSSLSCNCIFNVINMKGQNRHVSVFFSRKWLKII